MEREKKRLNQKPAWNRKKRKFIEKRSTYWKSYDELSRQTVIPSERKVICSIWITCISFDWNVQIWANSNMFFGVFILRKCITSQTDTFSKCAHALNCRHFNTATARNWCWKLVTATQFSMFQLKFLSSIWIFLDHLNCPTLWNGQFSTLKSIRQYFGHVWIITHDARRRNIESQWFIEIAWDYVSFYRAIFITNAIVNDFEGKNVSDAKSVCSIESADHLVGWQC